MTYVKKRPEVVAFKYLQKFANNTVTNKELNISEGVVDFIQDRALKTVEARHYMKLKRKALQFYPSYAKYLMKLGREALN